ncbi:MAG: 1-deoxy-D-xylulose-5-phosphate synthase, partial [Clostridiales bacterium]|nr:1-deoxy-D-xylulose-5-phosphate synthase [Clostridiales bacterium]
YEAAEHAPVNFHGVDAFSVETGEPSCSKNECYSDIFGKALVKLAAQNKDIVAVTAAMPDGTGLCHFKKRFPKRFFDVGIAEAHAVTFAAGLAKAGMRPVVAVYSSFLQRAYDQIMHDVCIQNLPVVFAVDRAGVIGQDGETHQGLFDISFLSHMPNMTVMAPKNKDELTAMLAFAVAQEGPVAIRYPKGEAPQILAEHNPPVQCGISETIFEGSGIALVSVGAMMETALRVAELLREKGYGPGLYNARFIKPLDMGLVSRLANYDYVYALEENARAGGYGSRLLEALTCVGREKGAARFHSFAFPDAYVEQGTRAEILQRYKLDAESVSGRILCDVNREK